MSANPSSSLPAIQTAVIQDEKGKPILVRDQPLPSLLPGTVLLKTTAVALNPSDYKMGAAFPTPGAVVGMDLATNTLALWDTLALAISASPDAPAEKPLPVLVNGGSTATGTLAIQLLRLSGLTPIAVCSPRNFDLVRDRGSEFEVDYVDPECTNKIRKETGGKLKHALDCIADPDSVARCYASISRVGGRYVSLESVPQELLTRQAVHAKFILGYECLGEDVPLPGAYKSSADPDKLRLAAKQMRVYERLLEEGLLRPHPIEQLQGGLHGVCQGLGLLKSGTVSGRKLVLTIR